MSQHRPGHLLAVLLTFICCLTSTAVTGAQAQTMQQPLQSLPAGTYKLDHNHANIIFKISHLGFSNYVGRFNDFDATLELNPTAPEQSKLDASINPDSVDTNNKTLEATLRSTDYFNTLKFPTISFTATKLHQTSTNAGTMTGDLTMLGVTRPITMAVQFVGGGMNPFEKKPVIGFSAQGSLNRAVWGMTKLLPMVGADVSFEINAEFDYAGDPLDNSK